MSFIDLVPEKSESIEIKSKIQQELDDQKAEFFKRGGKCVEIPAGICMEDLSNPVLYNNNKVTDKKIIDRVSRNASAQSSLANKKYKDAK